MHSIGKLSIDLHYTGKRPDGFELQRQMTRFCNEILLPALERRFDQLAGPEVWLSLDRLDLDAGLLRKVSNWDQLTQAILESLEKSLPAVRVPAKAGAGNITTTMLLGSTFERGLFEKWLYFLEFGYLPLSNSAQPEALIREKVLETVAGQASAVEALRRLLKYKPQALRRLLFQHPEAYLHNLAAAFTGQSFVQVTQDRASLQALFKSLAREKYFSKKYSARTVRQSPGSSENTVQELRQLLASAIIQILPDFQERYWSIVWRHILETNMPPLAATITTSLFEGYIPGIQIPHALNQLYQATAATAKKDLADRAFAQMQGENRGLNPEKSDDTKRPTLGSDKENRPAPEQPVQPRKAGKPAQEIAADQPAREITEHPKADQPVQEIEEHSRKTDQPAQEPARVKQPSQTHNPENAPKPKPAGQPEQYWYVENAGIVLLHPFLPILFKACNLLDQSDFRNLKCRQSATYLLHYLATGQTNPPEYELILPKLLCAWPEDEPLARAPRISQKTKTECRQLLEAAIRHWNKLGSTSPEGLQNGYLRRPGKLSSQNAEGWRLQIEQSGIDVLLRFLPWGIGMFKLPWMPDYLQVEWPT